MSLGICTFRTLRTEKDLYDWTLFKRVRGDVLPLGIKKILSNLFCSLNWSSFINPKIATNNAFYKALPHLKNHCSRLFLVNFRTDFLFWTSLVDAFGIETC